jgi:hypothetical protein
MKDGTCQKEIQYQGEYMRNIKKLIKKDQTSHYFGPKIDLAICFPAQYT